MAGETEHTKKPSTIPPWPSSAVDVSNVYKGCKKMMYAWSDDPDVLMPRSIESHSGAVLNASAPLASKFDVDWGGTSNIYFTVTFYDENREFIPPTGDWENPQKYVKVGTDAITPPFSAISSHYEGKDADLYTSSWSGKWQSVENDAKVYLTFTRKTHHAEFYDLYNLIHHGGEIIHLTDYDQDVNRKEEGALTVPNTESRNGYKFDCWTLSSGITETTSGEEIPLDGTFFKSVSQDFKAYAHGHVINFVNVSAYYYKDNTLTSTVSTIPYNGYFTPPELDERTGYVSNGWWINDTIKSSGDISKIPFSLDTSITANYNIIPISINFNEGYRNVRVASKTVDYGHTLPDSEFPTVYQLSDFNPRYPHMNHYGWDKTDSTKFENVTSTQEISSYYRTLYVENEIMMPSNCSSYTVTGIVIDNNPSSEFAFGSITSNIPETRMKNISSEGNRFCFDLIKDSLTVGKTTEVFSVSATDSNNLTYSSTFTAYENYDNIVFHLNEKSWWRQITRDNRNPETSAQYPYLDGADQGLEFLMPNPDESKYQGVFMTCSAWHKDNTYARARIEFTGYKDFTFYIRYDGEDSEGGGDDFLCVGKKNQSLSTIPTLNDPRVEKYVLTPKTSSSTAIEDYTKIEFDGLGIDESNWVDIAYVKGKTHYNGLDRAYLLFNVPNNSDRVDTTTEKIED